MSIAACTARRGSMAREFEKHRIHHHSALYYAECITKHSSKRVNAVTPANLFTIMYCC